TAPPNAPESLKFDREYQQAAALFYSQQWDKAHAAFQQIAKEPRSPWYSWGNYLGARALIRRSTLLPIEGHFDPAVLKAAEQELAAVIRSSREPKLRRAAARTMDFVRFRLHPIEYQRELNRVLSKPSDPAEVVRRLKDYLAFTGPESYLGYAEGET